MEYDISHSTVSEIQHLLKAAGLVSYMPSQESPKPSLNLEIGELQGFSGHRFTVLV